VSGYVGLFWIAEAGAVIAGLLSFGHVLGRVALIVGGSSLAFSYFTAALSVRTRSVAVSEIEELSQLSAHARAAATGVLSNPPGPDRRNALELVVEREDGPPLATLAPPAEREDDVIEVEIEARPVELQPRGPIGRQVARWISGLSPVRGRCRPELLAGTPNHVVDAGHRQYHNFFSDLWFGFDLQPYDEGLFILAWVRGQSWRGLWIRGGEVTIDFVVAVECLQAGDACVMSCSRRGKTNGEDGVVRLNAEVFEETSDGRLRVSVDIGAALNAAGGPEVTVGPKSVGSAKMAWPDATRSTVESMGRYTWACGRG
jgi:hypothetical protein